MDSLLDPSNHELDWGDEDGQGGEAGEVDGTEDLLDEGSDGSVDSGDEVDGVKPVEIVTADLDITLARLQRMVSTLCLNDY